MRLSVIIPVYQVEEYIERCLTSIINQDCKDFEIILVDDATKDNSMALAKKVLENVDIPVQYIRHEANRGLSAARNTGIDVARGDYLLFVDSDDALQERAINTFVSLIEQTHSDCIIGNYKVVSAANEYVSHRYSNKVQYDSQEAIRKAYMQGDIPIMAWNKCIKKSVLCEKNLYFKEGIYHEDELWTFLLVNEVKSIMLCGIATYLYYVREGSIMTNTKYESKLESGVVIYNEMVNYLEQKKLQDVNILTSLDLFAFQRYRDIFGNKSLGISTAKRFYRLLRLSQNKVARGLGKWGIIAKTHLVFPTSVGFYIMKTIIKLYSYKYGKA